MNQIKKTLTLCVAFFALASSQAFAGIMVTSMSDPTPASYEAIETTSSDLTLGSFTSAGGGDVNFWYGSMSDTSNALIGAKVDSNGKDINGQEAWWDPAFTIYTTGFPSQSPSIWIDLQNVQAYGFSFQIAANKPSTAWFDVYHEGSNSAARTNGISVNPNHSPGFQVASVNTGGSCKRITKIRVDPEFTWGVFNMGLDTVGDECVSVPEPSSLGLLGLALLGLGLHRRRLRNKDLAASA